MTQLTIPTPLRPYTKDQKEVQVEGETIGAVMQDLATRYPGLKSHLFDEDGELRPYVNIFINQEDIRILDGVNTPVGENDRLMIVPSIAGGTDLEQELELVDHAAIRTNQSTIITTLLIAFILDLPVLILLTASIMLIGTLFRKPGFSFIYRILRRTGVIHPEKLIDHPQPHLFSQGFGSLVLFGAALAFLVSFPVFGWMLTWVVILLAALNLFAGFCVGCAVYYWLNRLGHPWFDKSPPKGRLPGLRPRKGK